MPVPTIGRTVILRGIESNGATEHPAIITRSWSTRDTDSGAVAVNLVVFPDGAPAQCHARVMLFNTEYRAREYCSGKQNPKVAYWPSGA